jgi:hypothetical protein
MREKQSVGHESKKEEDMHIASSSSRNQSSRDVERKRERYFVEKVLTTMRRTK